MALNKITNSQITQYGVQAAPDRLTGTAAENKAIFDRLITSVVAVYFNELIDKLTAGTGADEIGATVEGLEAGTVGGVLDAFKLTLDGMDETMAGLVKGIGYENGVFTVTFEDGTTETINIASLLNEAIAKADEAAKKAEEAAANAEAIVGGDFVTTPVLEAAVESLDTAKADKSKTHQATLVAASWSGNTYTLAVEGITTTSNQEVLPGLDITTEQLEALQGANLQDGGQAEGNITIQAFGTVPTVDIPVRVIVRGD